MSTIVSMIALILLPLTLVLILRGLTMLTTYLYEKRIAAAAAAVVNVYADAADKEWMATITPEDDMPSAFDWEPMHNPYEENTQEYETWANHSPDIRIAPCACKAIFEYDEPQKNLIEHCPKHPAPEPKRYGVGYYTNYAGERIEGPFPPLTQPEHPEDMPYRQEEMDDFAAIMTADEADNDGEMMKALKQEDPELYSIIKSHYAAKIEAYREEAINEFYEREYEEMLAEEKRHCTECGTNMGHSHSNSWVETHTECESCFYGVTEELSRIDWK